MGDVLKVREDEGIPADMVLLHTAQDNISYVETKDIDGETNLKLKSANMKLSDLQNYQGLRVQCEPASDKIYSFTGVALATQEQVSVGYENFLLRGCRLRNTSFVIGVAAYVGKDTRIMRNLIIGKQKKSDLELNLQWQILFVFCVQLIFASTAAFYTIFWEKRNEDSTNVYLQFYP